VNELRRFAGAILYLGRGAAFSVWDNLSLAVLALALAVSLWLYVTERENPTEQRTFTNPIAIQFVNVADDLAVAGASAATVQIRVEASEAQFDDLTVDDLEATVDLGGLPAGQHSVPVEVDAPDRVNIVRISPATVDVSIEPRRSRDVPVRVELVGSPQTGFAAEEVSIEPQTATVTGAESLVALVDAVVAEVNVTGLRIDVSEDRVPLEPRDARDGAISRVSVSPQTAEVDIEIVQREFSSQFVVAPAVSGQPAAGYNVTAVTVEPRLVTVTGTLEVLQSIDSVAGISTEEISIADARATVRRTVQLNLPQGARLEGNPSIVVEVRVEPARGEFTFLVAPQVQNVGEGLAVTPAEPVAVTLAGDVPTLQQVTAQQIIVIADASGLGPGLHVLQVQVTPPPNTQVTRIEPGQLGVALNPR